MSEYYITRSPDYLEHHGILGMKWGVRRFQNPDGSLTPEGRARYGDVLTKKQMENYIREYNLRTGSKKTINKNTVFKTPNGMYDYKGRKLRNADVEVENPAEEKHTESKPKNEHRMSDEELRAANTRMQLELDYRQKMSQLNPKKVTMGQQFVDNLKADLVKDIPAGISGMVKNAIASAGSSKPDANATKDTKRTDTSVDISKLSDQEQKDVKARLETEAAIRDLKSGPKTSQAPKDNNFDSWTDQQVKDYYSRQQNLAKIAQLNSDPSAAAKTYTEDELEELLKKKGLL